MEFMKTIRMFIL